MNKFIILVLVSLSALPAIAKNTVAENFIENVKKAADTNGEISTSVNVICPAPSASGVLLLTHADYEYGKSKGVYDFKNTSDTPLNLKSITAKTKDDDLMSDDVIGWEFGFIMPGGQFFITILQSGKAIAGVNKNGTTGITEINCKVSSSH